MDVMVYWSADGIKDGAIDHYTSPYEDGWSAWRVEFYERQRGTWSVRIVRLNSGQQARRESVGMDALARNGAGKRTSQEVVFLDGLTSDQRSFPAYNEWLEENVDAIQVNGYPWWQSNRLGE